MRTAFTSLLLIAYFGIQAQSWNIQRLGYPNLDGYLNEWHQIPPILFSTSDSTPGISNDGRGPIDHINDLKVEVKLGWNDDGLFAALSWQDDVLDTENLPYEKRRWNHPNGGARDRMYYNDNLVFRFFRGDSYFYGIWVTPDKNSPFQWHSLRLGPRGTESTPTSPPEISAKRVEAGVVQLEIFWSWEKLHFQPRTNENITLQILATDADQPTIPLIVKEANVRYLHTRQTFIFRN